MKADAPFAGLLALISLVGFMAVPTVAAAPGQKLFVSLSKADTNSDKRGANLERVVGEVRVVLLRVVRGTAGDGTPSVTVTYGVEVPVQGAFSDLAFDSSAVELVVAGKQVSARDGIATSSMSTAFKELPRQHELTEPVVQEGKAMLAEEVEFGGLQIRSNKVDVRTQFMWRKSKVHCEFKDVPLRTTTAAAAS